MTSEPWSLFCCGPSSEAAQPQPNALREVRFAKFIEWAKSSPHFVEPTGNWEDGDLMRVSGHYCIQLVHFRASDGKYDKEQFFASVQGSQRFVKVVLVDLINYDYKLSSYKEFRCDDHDKFFEINMFEKKPDTEIPPRTNAATRPDWLDLGLTVTLP